MEFDFFAMSGHAMSIIFMWDSSSPPEYKLLILHFHCWLLLAIIIHCYTVAMDRTVVYFFTDVRQATISTK